VALLYLRIRQGDRAYPLSDCAAYAMASRRLHDNRITIAGCGFFPALLAATAFVSLVDALSDFVIHGQSSRGSGVAETRG